MRRKGSGKEAVLIAAILCLWSCVYEDRGECILTVSFRYTYNVKCADAFSSEVRSIDLYVFDGNGLFLSQYSDSVEGAGGNYTMNLSSLESGTYSFVAIGRNRVPMDYSREFALSDLTRGVSTVEDLTMRLNRVGDVSNNDFASVYNGVTRVALKSGRQNVHIDMHKITNRYRIIIMPYSGGTVLQEDRFDFRIEADGAWLDYEGKRYCNDPVKWLPYNVAVSSTKADEVSCAIVADLASSRLFRDDDAVLVIGDGRGEEYLRLNLPWFLSLQGIAEHRNEWDDQEYLDRQDYYSITFFIDGNLFVKSKIIVNGWVLSLTDVTLG